VSEFQIDGRVVRRDRDPRRLSHPERVAHNHERVVTDAMR
jgi:hypothetical protein